jgi:AcrR family transcriptional regulator
VAPTWSFRAIMNSVIDESGAAEAPRRRAVGRPRLLTRAQVVETAAQIAPGELTMTRLAETLRVSPGTLYQYVADRDELIRLVIEKRMRDLPLLEDTGQHWSDYLREYINRLASALTADPAAIAQVLGIESTVEPELRFTEAFYAALVARGFGLDETMEIYVQVSIVAMGAAMVGNRERLAAKEAGSVGAALRRVLEGLGEDEVPLVRKAARLAKARSLSARDLTDLSARGLTEILIESIARQRGETAGNADGVSADARTTVES